MTKYAEGTTVPASRTRAEIEMTLQRWGATAFGYATTPQGAQVAFEMHGSRIRMAVAMPLISDYRRTKTGLVRSEKATSEFHDQAIRQRWRALLLVVKAKLEAVESGVETFEQAWFPYVVLPNGRTVFEEAAPQIAAAMSSGAVGPLIREDLPALGR